jgi:hypothetical protein
VAASYRSSVSSSPFERGAIVAVPGETRVMRHSVLTLPARRDAAA